MKHTHYEPEYIMRGPLTTVAKFAFERTATTRLTGTIPGIGHVESANAFEISPGVTLAFGDDFIAVMRVKEETESEGLDAGET